MKKRTSCIALSLCLLCTLFSGCVQQEETLSPGAMGSEVWEVIPLTYGKWESEPLSALPWNCGRCEATSKNTLAETETGYYMVYFGYLYYASKADLTNWLKVCNKPDCAHRENDNCHAYLVTPAVIIKDNRIYFQTNARMYPHLNPYQNNQQMLVSMAPDGTDKQFVYAVEEASFTGAGMCTSFLSDSNWLHYVEYLDTSGNLVRTLYQTTVSGTKKIPISTQTDADAYIKRFANGEEAYYSNVLGAAEYGCYRFVAGEVVETECTGLNVQGAYLFGNTLRTFRPGDGYYDIDLTTREEVFLAPAQLQDSKADIALPNCIIESTLYNGEDWMADKPHEMRLFDGQKWREVSLPEELANRENGCSNLTVSVCSDSILFHFWGENSTRVLYRIPLAENELKAELCAVIGG